MSQESDELPEPPVGAIVWTDLTVPDGAAIRDFYAAAVGWEPNDHDMGDYNDYLMATAEGDPVAGICYRRGPNIDAPPVWLVYVRVADLDDSLAAVRARGGSVVDGPRSGFAVITDPAGAHLALFDPHHPSADDEEADAADAQGHGHSHGHDGSGDHGHGHSH